MRRYTLYILFALLLHIPSLRAAVTNDSIQISLLTVSPGQEVYEVFGHTALRVKQGERDWVFNYGLFDFEAPNFIYRFVKGETDYQLGINNFQSFLVSYAMRGAEVREQTLNINQEEAKRILEALLENYKPENRVYRYNFFHDNCATRPRDMIIENIDHEVRYTDTSAEKSYRTWVREKTQAYPWLMFGMDLALGSKADLLATYQRAMFLPEELHKSFNNAIKIPMRDPLVLTDEVLLTADPSAVETSSFKMIGPATLGYILWALILLLSIYDFKAGQPSRWLDTVLFLIAGIAGCIIYFLNFVSVHPAVDANFHTFWLHPIYLLLCIGIWVKTLNDRLFYFHFANFVVIVALLVMSSVIPQGFPLPALPYMGILATRAFLRIALHMKLLQK